MITRSTKMRATLAILAGMICCTLATNGAPRGSAEEQALEADHNFLAAAEDGNKTAARALLDEDFEWTDAEGKTRSKTESLQNLHALAEDNKGDGNVQSYSYDRMEVITGVHHDARFMRVWVNRPDGWRAFAVVDTPIGHGAAPFATAANSAADCKNPCRMVPYEPKTETDKTIVALLERLKMDEWHPNPDDWSPYVLDGVYYVTSAGALSKADRVTHLEQEKKSGAAILPGDPVISMRMFDFGGSAVMITRNAPYRGGKPYYSLRVWTYRDGRWQLANSQQTMIIGAAVVGPASGTK